MIKMNGKMHSETGAFSSDGMRAEILNPFVHKLELDNAYDKIKTAIFTVILLPFRVIVICYLIVTAWLIACVGLYGLSEEDLRRQPMTGWRRSLKPLICFIGKMSYLAGGMAITTRGRQASRQEAPILVVAPHSSFLDSCIVYATKMSSVIVRKESMDNYVGSRFCGGGYSSGGDGKGDDRHAGCGGGYDSYGGGGSGEDADGQTVL